MLWIVKYYELIKNINEKFDESKKNKNKNKFVCLLYL